MAGYRRRTNRNGSESWELTWREKGKPCTLSLGPVAALREPEVREIARRKDRELALAEHGTNKPHRSFATACAEYLAWHVHEYPDSHWRVDDIVTRRLLVHFTGTLEGVSQLDVERFKLARLNDEPQPAPATVTKELRTLSAILNRCVKLGQLTRNPAALVKAPRSLNNRKGYPFFTADELQLVYTKGAIEPWHKYAWMLYAGSGARRMELLNLKWADVGSDTLHLVSTGEERTKSGQGRDVPISAGAREALAFFRTWEKRSDLYVLPRVHPSSLSRIAIKCIKRAKLTGSLHKFRHTFISRLAMVPEIPVLAIKEWAGHSTLAVTEKYMHLRPSVTDDILRGMVL